MNNLLAKLQRDLELKGFSPKTKNIYLKQIEKQRSSSSVNQAYSALKFFFIHTLDREWESQTELAGNSA